MGDTLVYKLPKRIDATNSDAVLKDINEKIAESDYSSVNFDANELEYISSAGLRVLLSIKKKTGNNVLVTDVSKEVYEIFDVTGFNQLLNVKKKMREVSVEGCKIIGTGFCGTVYRLDAETIIKVFESKGRDNIAAIENEKKMAQLALINGVPTAISYDIVKVGEYYGAVYELLDARNFNDIIKKEPERVEEISKKLVDFLRMIHEIEIEDKILPSSKKLFRKYLSSIQKYFEEPFFTRMSDLIETIPESRHVVHGDPHMKNIMMVAGEPMFIDMDTLSAGDSIFDLQALYATYIAFAEDEPENNERFLGIKQELAIKVWDNIMNYYYEDKTEEEKVSILEKIRILAYIRMMHIVTSSSLIESEVGKLRISHSVEHLRELVPKYDRF